MNNEIGERPWFSHYDPQVPRHLEYPDIPLHALLQRSAVQFSDQTCLVFFGQELSYTQVDRLTDRLAAALQAAGLRRGDRVALMLPNSIHFVACYFAVLKSGGVVVALNPVYKITELAYQLRDSGARFWIGLDSAAPLVREAAQHCNLEWIIFSWFEDLLQVGYQPGETHAEKEVRLVELLSAVPDGARPEGSVSADEPAVFQYTGGTTGVPKGAIGLHRNLFANAIMFQAWSTGLQPGKETILAAIPLFHVYGMVLVLGMGISLGARLILIMDPRQVDPILDAIQQYHVTLYPAVPLMVQAMLAHPAVVSGEASLDSIKGCISGSAPLLPALQAAFEQVSTARMREGYGLSEAPTATHCNPAVGENRPGSIGLPLPDVDCRIVDLETGTRELPQGEVGELLVRGPQVMAGYHNQPEETALALRGGWLYTGDIAWMDPDGYFYLVGRKKELIKVGGLQVWPREVEETLEKHPAVKEACVAGVPHTERCEVVKAWVVLQDGRQVSAEELRMHCATLMADYKVPYLLEFRSELPRSMIGKLLRRDLVSEHNEAIAQ